MSQVTVKKENGQFTANMSVNIDLGKIYPYIMPSEMEGVTSHAVIMQAHVPGMLLFYEQLVFDRANGDSRELFVEALEEYAKWHLMNQLGITATPLQFDEQMGIKGLDKDIKILAE